MVINFSCQCVQVNEAPYLYKTKGNLQHCDAHIMLEDQD
jgi:hypothetical protein